MNTDSINDDLKAGYGLGKLKYWQYVVVVIIG